MIQPCKQWLFSVSLCFGFSLLCFGQQPKTFEGPLQMRNYSGQAVYQYTISDLDTIFNGDFLWEQSNLETLVENEDTSFRISGTFDQGRANGPWQFEFGEYQTNSQSQVVGYEYRVLVSGTQEKGEGLLVDGKPDGNWTYTINQIKDSEISKILFKSSIDFDKGVPQQNFQIENDSSVLVGRFLRNGLAHDEWSYYGTERVEDMEDWFFDDGLLLSIRFKTEEGLQEIGIFDTEAPNYRTIALDYNFISLLKVMLEERNVGSGIAKTLTQHLEYYEKINSVLEVLGSHGFQMDAKVKVPFYPLDSLQQKTLEQISSDYKLAAGLSRTILHNSHLNIVKRTDPEAFFYYNVAQKIQRGFLKPLQALISYQEKGIVPYQEIPAMVQRLWPNGKPNTEITVAANESGEMRSFSLPSSEEFGYEGNDLLSVAALATYARMSLEYIKGSLASRLTNEEQLQMLNGLEEELIQLNNLLEREVDSVSGLTMEYRNAMDNLQKVADSSLTTYADMKNPDEKLAYGNSVKTCLMELTDLAQTLKNIPQQQEAIKKEYTNAVWNPFMANVMAEQVKKRITESYEEVLIPYFLKATDSLECGNVKELNEQIMQSHKTIFGLRNKDTRKLERKLRREKRPLEVLRLLQVTSTPKNQ
jgi:hypothetical protein